MNAARQMDVDQLEAILRVEKRIYSKQYEF